MNQSTEEDNGIIQCWCGARGTFDELFDDEPSGKTCGGLGQIPCECGGDLCVCHNHGAIECDGCEDCFDDDFGEF